MLLVRYICKIICNWRLIIKENLGIVFFRLLLLGYFIFIFVFIADNEMDYIKTMKACRSSLLIWYILDNLSLI